jgi:2-polyprenyl-3-methyl-5-hydroxy-6-metoxy-1,4-benzoquinol methylase
MPAFPWRSPRPLRELLLLFRLISAFAISSARTSRPKSQSISALTSHSYKDYGFADAAESHMHRLFMPHVMALAGVLTPGTRVLDVGCGNAAACGEFIRRGCKVVGIDLSEQGITWARSAHPCGRFEILAADELILDRLQESPFDLVISTEVVEHLYAPREWAKGCFRALKPGGRLICTTPYHGYLKNLLLSVLGKWDAHANPLWDGGHIKLWSPQSLALLLTEAGFANLKFRGAGRLPYLWMTMVMSAHKPPAQLMDGCEQPVTGKMEAAIAPGVNALAA